MFKRRFSLFNTRIKYQKHEIKNRRNFLKGADFPRQMFGKFRVNKKIVAQKENMILLLLHDSMLPLHDNSYISEINTTSHKVKFDILISA